MTSNRIKEIQEETAYPKSVSVMLALKQVWNECAQESYSKEEVLEILDQHSEYLETFIYQYIDKNDMEENEEWFKQFKKK